MPIPNYGMLKGKLVYGVPYLSSYHAKPHYVLVLDTEGQQATVVVNSMSVDGTEVGVHTDRNFTSPIVAELEAAAVGFPATFPRLDYYRGFKLGDPANWSPVPYAPDGSGGSQNDINDLISSLAEVDTTSPPVIYPFNNGETSQDRQAFKPTVDVTVVAFGQTFPGGIHDAHMSQGTPTGSFAKSNGINQDGAIFFIVGGLVRAHFTVFSSQLLPTDAAGFPLAGALPVCPALEEN